MSLLDNLISYWKLDEASGNALDAHGTNELTDNNTVGSATGKINNCREFQSANLEFFKADSNSSLETGDIDFTISAWVRFATVDNMVIAKGNATDGDEYWIYPSLSKMAFTVFPAVETVSATTFGNLSTNVWYHTVCWHDSVNNVIGVAVNNVADTLSFASGVAAGAGQFVIGALGTVNTSNHTGYFDGLIDEVGFWKRVLTSQERSDLYNGGSGLAYPFTMPAGAWLHRPRPRRVRNLLRM